ncbi:hypothetical protein SAMN04488522_104679 [Pedobacter caeni]|uniref:Uncharacterized protein n=2 Tax=Pedobacter caeni TaxID=288992 RepID=A0A1M5HIS0_9SPHI|nr:hypothetical protein SAMN04488522_104679 [Pedobacter caeni]
MERLSLIAEIIFLETAKNSFSFPIGNSIRMSFWLPGDKASTFSEIQINNKIIDLGKHEILEIKLGDIGLLLSRIQKGTEFRMGTFPNEIAIGKVIEIKRS